MNQIFSTKCPRCGGALIPSPKTLREMAQDFNHRSLLATVTAVPFIFGAGIAVEWLERAGMSNGSIKIIATTLVLLGFALAMIVFHSRKRWGRIQCIGCSARFRQDQVIRESRAP